MVVTRILHPLTMWSLFGCWKYSGSFTAWLSYLGNWVLKTISWLGPWIHILNKICFDHICLFSWVLKCRSPLECIGFSMDFRRTQSSYIRNSFDLDRSQTLECNIKEKKRRIEFFSKVSSGFCTNGPSIIFSEYWHFENKKKQQFCRDCIYND